MALAENNVFKYPSEDECLVRRLGSGVIAAWPGLPREIQDKILAEAKTAWDREFHVSHLGDKLTSILRRRS